MLRQLLVTVPLVFGLAATAIAADGTSSASRLDAIMDAGVLKVGTTGDYKPFTFKDKQKTEQGADGNAAYTGFDIDQAQSLADALGVKLKIVPTSWPKLMEDFRHGDFDLAMGGVSVTLERQKAGLFSDPYMEEGKTPIARCEDKGKYDTIADIDKPEVTVVVNPGGTNEKFDRAHFKQAHILLVDDNTKTFDQLVSGKADVMITDASETRYQAKMHKGVLCAVHPDTPFNFAEKAYWIQRDPFLKAFVDQWLHLSRNDGNYQKIYDKWFK